MITVAVLLSALLSAPEAFTAWDELAKSPMQARQDAFTAWDESFAPASSQAKPVKHSPVSFQAWEDLCTHKCPEGCTCGDSCQCSDKCECLEKSGPLINNELPKKLQPPTPSISARPSYPTIPRNQWGTMVENGRHFVWTKPNLIDHLCDHANHKGQHWDRAKLQQASLEELAALHIDDHNKTLKSEANWYRKISDHAATKTRVKPMANDDSTKRMAVYRHEPRTVTRCTNGICRQVQIEVPIFDHWLN